MPAATWIDALSLPWDLRQGPFRAFFPPEGKERQACKLMLEENYSLASYPLKKAQWAACQETRTGKLVASVLLFDAETYQKFARKQGDDSSFASVTDTYLPHLGVFVHLCVHPDYAQTTAVEVLLLHCLTELLKAGGQGALMRCRTDNLIGFKRIGLRPIAAPTATGAAGSYLPMIFVPDQAYLSIIHSPLLPLLRSLDFAKFENICNWYHHLVRTNSDLRIGTAFLPEENASLAGHHTITEGLSEAGRAVLLKNTLIRYCSEGEVLIAENDDSKAFGFVQKGIVQVIINADTIIHLSEGDIFGEIAFILDTRRTARVVAAGSDTQVILFNQAALDLLESATDRLVIWRSLARILAQRLVMTNQLLG